MNGWFQGSKSPRKERLAARSIRHLATTFIGAALVPLLALLASLALLVACGSDPPPPSIVLVSIDTLRSDRLPAYGYTAISTPHLDALRADSILFQSAYSPTPTTLPAHASMLTGLLPPDHGVRGNVGYSLDAARLPYLPTRLKGARYATGAAVSSFVMRSEAGLATSFDFYEDAIDYGSQPGSAGFQRSGPETLEALTPWLREVAGGPFFLFVHLYDPHTPYAPPEPYASRYESAYDGEIAAVDEVVGGLIEELRALGVYDDTVVLLTSDHGEGLGDHGESEHGIFLYREAIQVPLFLKLPGKERSGETVNEPAQLSDIFPTLLDLAGVGVPPDSAARSLVRLAAGDTPRQIYSETFFPRFYFGWSELVSVIEGNHHYIESPEPELFNLDTDPTEWTNLLESDPDTTRRLAQHTRGYEYNLVDPEDADLETWSRMASLGYVGHGQTRTDAELPAPASQVHLLDFLRDGLAASAAGRYAEAVRTLSAVVSENPNALVAWEQLASSFERLGRPADALRAYTTAIGLSGRAPHLVLAAARTSFRTGKVEEALTLAREALDWDEAASRTLMGEIALSRGELDDAYGQSQAAVALRSPNSSAMFTLAQVELHRGNFEEALEITRQNEAAVGRPVPRLELLRGNILASMGSFTEAEKAFRREIELFPTSVAVYPRMAVFLARQGRPEEAAATVRLLVENNPTPAGYLAAARALELLGDSESARAILDEAQRRFARSEPRPAQ